MQIKLRAVTEELERAYKNHEVQSISRLTAAVVLELAKIQLARTPLEAPAPVDRFTPPAGYVECMQKCGRWTGVVTVFNSRLQPVCWDCWTNHGRAPRPSHAAPDWVMPAAKPDDVHVTDRMVSANGHVSTVLTVETGYWRMSDPEFPHSDGPSYWALDFAQLGKSMKLLPRAPFETSSSSPATTSDVVKRKLDEARQIIGRGPTEAEVELPVESKGGGS